MSLQSGYVPCACRDCFEIAIGDGGPTLCSDCDEAGCEIGGDAECEVTSIVPEEAEFEVTAKTVVERQHHTCCGERITTTDIVYGNHGCVPVRR